MWDVVRTVLMHVFYILCRKACEKHKWEAEVHSCKLSNYGNCLKVGELKPLPHSTASTQLLQEYKPPWNLTYAGPGNDEEVFADGKVTYAGQLVGMVVAETRMQARTAAKAVNITYEDLQTVLTIEVSADHDCTMQEKCVYFYHK